MRGIIEFFKRAKKQALGIFRTSTNTYRDKNWDSVLCPVSSISFSLLFAPPGTRVPIFTLVEIGVKLALDRYRFSSRDVPKSKIWVGIGFYQTPKFFRRIFCSVCNNPNITREQRSNISFKPQSFLVKRIVTPEKYRKEIIDVPITGKNNQRLKKILKGCGVTEEELEGVRSEDLTSTTQALKKEREGFEALMVRFPNKRVWNVVRRYLIYNRKHGIIKLSIFKEIVESGEIFQERNIGVKAKSFLKNVLQTIEKEASP